VIRRVLTSFGIGIVVGLVVDLVLACLVTTIIEIRGRYWERRRVESLGRLAESERLLEESKARLAATNERLLAAETDAFLSLLWDAQHNHNEEN